MIGGYGYGGGGSGGMSPAQVAAAINSGKLKALQSLFTLTNADMNSTADQIFQKAFSFSVFSIKEIIVHSSSVALAGALGGIYTGAGKTGTIIVAATQTYTGASAANVIHELTRTTAGTRRLSGVDLILSLSTPLGTPATASLEVMGYPWAM